MLPMLSQPALLLTLKHAMFLKLMMLFFARAKGGATKNGEAQFFNNERVMTEEDKKALAMKKATQKEVDAKLLEAVKKVEHLAGYLRTRFSLRNNMRFHEMSF